jgi:uncharacterized protein (TIGR02246 family)
MLVLVIALVLSCTPLMADQEAEIKAMLLESVEVWNRGDLVAFASFYEDTPETTFVGKEVTRGGVDAILGRYKRAYGSREKMGTLRFANLHVRPLTAELAIVTGEFHLTRSEAGGGDASGKYSLVVKKTAKGWKIIHDHTG